jgi:hypothetical protein
VFQIIEQSAKALEQRNIGFFSDCVPREEWWRLSDSFPSKIVFLDIETTGLSLYYDEVTLVVGMYDGQDVNTITPLFAYCRSIWICDTCSDVWAIPADSKKSSTDSGSAGLRVSKARLCRHRKLPVELKISCGFRERGRALPRWHMIWLTLE